MHVPSYLLKNSFGIYHLRLAVPKKLRYLFGRREIKKSLQTRSYREALRKAWKLATFYLESFEKMAKTNDYEKLVNNPLNSKLKVNIVRHPDGNIEFQNLEMDPDKADIEKDLLDHAVECYNKVQAVPVIGQSPATPVAIPHQPQVAQVTTDSVSLGDLVHEYLDELKGHCDSRTINNYAAQLDTFVEILGDVPISSINRKRAKEALKTLKQLPPNRNKSKIFKDLSIASLTQLKPSKVMSPTTVKLYIDRIAGLFQYAIIEEYVTKNPFVEIIKEKPTRRPDEERQIFEDEHLKALFNPVNRKAAAGRESRHWIPLIAAYSGLRLEEIAQMEASDIVQVNGIFCFDINDHNGKHLKNATADRQVPIHSKLLANYFMIFVQKQRGQRLFPDLTLGNGRYGHHFSKWFGRYRQKCGVVEEGLTFHSFRHNVATQLKYKNVDVTKVAAILGHTVNGQSYGRYGKPYKPEHLQPVIEMIDYGDAVL